MKKTDLFEETFGLFAQEVALRYRGTARPEDVLAKVGAQVAEIKNGQGKRSDNHTASLNSKNDTGSSSIASIKGGGESKTMEAPPGSKDCAEDLKKSEGEKIIIRSKPLNPSNVRLFFARSAGELRTLNPQLSEITEKFADFKMHKGFFFVEQLGRRMFELSDISSLDQYVLLNCFATYLVSSQLGENKGSFEKVVARIRNLEAAASKQVIAFSGFLAKFNEILGLLSANALQASMDLLVDSCAQTPGFMTTLVWSLKSLVGEFLTDMKQAKRNSYLQKYYIIDCLLFGVGCIKEEDNSLYKLMRYCVEVFFITVDAFCELIYIRKADLEYHYKNIFINKPKDALLKKQTLFYLLVIEEKYSLFSSFELPDTSPSKKVVSLTDLSSQKRPIEADVNRGSIENSIPEEAQPAVVGFSSPLHIDADLSPIVKQDGRLQLIQVPIKPIDIPTEFSKSELSGLKPQSHYKSIYKIDQSESASHLPITRQQFSEGLGTPSIYRQQAPLRPEKQVGLSPPKEQPKSKLTTLRSGSDSVSFFDRESAVIGLMNCLEEMDSNFTRLAAQRVNPPKTDLFSRGRSYGREISQNHTSKITRIAGRSQDVGFNHRYTSGTRLNLFSGGLANGLTSNISLKQDRNNLLGRDQLYRGLDFKYSNTISGPPSTSYRYANFTDSALSGNLRRGTSGEQPTYLIN